MWGFALPWWRNALEEHTRESLTRRGVFHLALCLEAAAATPVRLPAICAVWINHTPPDTLWCNFWCALTRADSWNARNRNKITVEKKKREMRRCHNYSHVSTCKAPELLFSPRHEDACLGVKRGKWSANWSNTRVLSLLNALWCMNTNFTLCERMTGRQNALSAHAISISMTYHMLCCLFSQNGGISSFILCVCVKEREIIIIIILNLHTDTVRG